jgi:hypothetical protein
MLGDSIISRSMILQTKNLFNPIIFSIDRIAAPFAIPDGGPAAAI